MTFRFASTNLDLSRLPAPEVIKPVDYEQILAERLADLVARFKAIGIDLDTTSLEKRARRHP
jgi:phage-related baseplate assembly protein